MCCQDLPVSYLFPSYMAFQFSSSLPGEVPHRDPGGHMHGRDQQSHLKDGTEYSLRENPSTTPAVDGTLVFSRELEDVSKDRLRVDVDPITRSSTFGQNAAASMRHHVTRGLLAALVVVGFLLGEISSHISPALEN